jgi:hypothetical protein
MKSIGKSVGLIVLVVVLCLTGIIFLFGGSLNRVQSNEWGCLYGGGLTESKALKQTIAPGQSGGFTVFDNLVTIPSDDRIYAIDSDPSTADFGGTEIIVPAKGTDAENNGVVPVVVPIQVRFTINENGCELYNNYLKGKAGPLDWNGTEDTPGAWPKFLNLQMNQVLNTAARSQISGKSYVSLYTDFSTYPAIQTSISTTLSNSLTASLGGQFFCGPSYKFDGDVDGVVDDCPPLEIIIKEIKPQDPIFLDNLKKIVANQEAQTVIKSDKEKAIAQTNADKEASLASTEAEKEKSLAVTEADKEKALAATAANEQTQLAEVERQQNVEAAQVAKDLIIAEATTALVAVTSANEATKAEAEATFCKTLEAIGTDCAEYFRALNWKPTIITGGDSNLLINPNS